MPGPTLPRPCSAAKIFAIWSKRKIYGISSFGKGGRGHRTWGDEGMEDTRERGRRGKGRPFARQSTRRKAGGQGIPRPPATEIGLRGFPSPSRWDFMGRPLAAETPVVPVKLALRHCPPNGRAFPAPPVVATPFPFNPLPSRWDSKGLSPLAAGGSSASSSLTPYRRIHLRRRALSRMTPTTKATPICHMAKPATTIMV